jgi:hypothetical protein
MDSLENLSLKQRHQLGITFVPMKTEITPKPTIKTINAKLDKSQKQSSQLFSFLSTTKSNN